MPITLTSTDVIVSESGSFTVTSTSTATFTITLNPLTTAWDPPAYCTESYLSNCQTDAISGTLPCFVSLYPEGVCDSTGQSCYPAVPGVLGNTYLYSPGLACPTMWTTASQGVLSPTGGPGDETTAHCCPSCVPISFSPKTNKYLTVPRGLHVTTYGTYSTWCEGTVTAGEETMIVNGLSECPSSSTAFTFGPSTPVDLTWMNVDSTMVSVSGDAQFTVSAEQVVLLYKSSDFTAAGGSSTTSGTGATASTGMSGGSSTEDTGRGSSGLSTGATAGIAIAAAAVGVAALLGMFYLFLRYRNGKSAMREGKQGSATRAYSDGNGELPGLHSSEGSVLVGIPQSQYEHKANDLELPRSSNGRPPLVGVAEMQGSHAPVGNHAWCGLPPITVGDHAQAGSERPVAHEVSGESHDYHQLPLTATRVHLDESRQSTPIEMIRPQVGSRGL